jgi:zona occludens toxin
VSIQLITGLPGSGKSLRLVQRIESFLAEGRPVFAHNVYGLKLPGVIELSDPNDWESLPHGSVIVVDECHKVWPQSRAEPIPPVVALREHRHQGKDFVLVTQFPSFLNINVRRLAQPHEHLVRKFGLEASTVFSWNEGQSDVESQSVRELAEQSLWAFPKHLYDKYTSATIHTVKRRIPKALIVIAAAAILIPALAWSAYSTITGWSEKPSEAAPEQDSPGLPGLSAQAAPTAAQSPVMEYAAQFTPRIAGVAWSAPAYDRFEVQDYPRPHCVIVGDQAVERIACRCYTQQVTPMEMEERACIQIARYGAWDPFKAPLQSSNDPPRADDEPPPWEETESQPPVGMGEGIDRSVLQPYIPPDFLPR